jgi:hypothetical protein
MKKNGVCERVKKEVIEFLCLAVSARRRSCGKILASGCMINTATKTRRPSPEKSSLLCTVTISGLPINLLR